MAQLIQQTVLRLIVSLLIAKHILLVCSRCTWPFFRLAFILSLICRIDLESFAPARKDTLFLHHLSGIRRQIPVGLWRQIVYLI